MTCHKFSNEFISRFIDNELDEEDRNAFIRHKAQCLDCCAVETRFKQTGMIFEQQADDIIRLLLKDTPEIFIKTNERAYKFDNDRIMKPKSRGAQAVFAILSLAVVVAIMYLTPWYQGKPSTGLSVPGPSAVVNSVDAYGSSVMILETAETHHTIIWFSET
ncbi:zf-HC2 domain-containing protein [uncultured Desulfobacter sp.]|uniref:zf-HC2 domain-containing protein n=1 Tax=uncultured Desulfobacter sp. TaxID=240139 RepID=UPI0029F46614|nr:zf-HC2 domain-containing protein [uncultured Desulfobacter sp.]